MKASTLFSLPASLPFGDYFRQDDPPWVWVKKIAEALKELDWSGYEKREDIPAGICIQADENVFIHPTVKLPAYATIQGPAWIGAETEIRPGAYIRGNVIVGEGCVLGNSCEFKNCLLMNKVQTPHYNYVGDSILGTGAHLGAGVILANLRLDKGEVIVDTPEGRQSTGLRKLGAILGEYAEAGCNAVLQPGTILGKRAMVMSTLAFSGFLAENTIAHAHQPIRRILRRD